jgi:hypothetical protein
LTSLGNLDADLWIFEVGGIVESSELKLRPANAFTETQLQLFGIPDADADGYYEVASISGGTSSLDIDAVIPGFDFGELQFDAVEIIDVVDGECIGGTPGADIDAVCALSSITLVDCADMPNGTAIIDACGTCLDPTDPNFNACIDCVGTPNGTAVTDECGACLEPTFPNFDQSCADERTVYIPNVFSVNEDGINDRFQIFKHPETNARIVSYLIFTWWGELIHEQINVVFRSSVDWWDGNLKEKRRS